MDRWWPTSAPGLFLKCQPLLKDLAAELDWASAVFSRGEALPKCDFQCPLLSLPLAFDTDIDTVPAKVPYLFAPKDRIETWRARLPQSDVLRVGLVWSGNPDNPVDAIRSMAFERLAPVLDLPGIEFVSLQKDVRARDAAALKRRPDVLDLGPELKDFSDTAAVISLLDVVVAVETAVAHLVGGQGVPVWIMLPFSPGWRWLLEREDSPWYPTARLFRQKTMGDWDGVIERVRAEFVVLAESHRGV